jgi:hypothetical protein
VYANEQRPDMVWLAFVFILKKRLNPKRDYINRMACTKKVNGNGMISQNHWGQSTKNTIRTMVDTVNSIQCLPVEEFSVFIATIIFFCAAKVETSN